MILAGIKPYRLLIALVVLAGIDQAVGQTGRFFRIAGPAATTIVALQPDGNLVWTNAQPGAIYEVQTTESLADGTNWVDYVQLPTTNASNTNLLLAFDPPAGMALIPAGSFMMGDTLDGESDAIPTNIYVSSFYMDVNLVSFGQWQTVYTWGASNGYGYPVTFSGKAADVPVDAVYFDWYDAVKWSNARSQQEGLTPVYYTDTNLTQVYKDGEVTPYVNWSANGYRLPTEAEWEKAARGGLIGQRFPWGDTISESQANYVGDTNEYSYDLGPSGYNSVGKIGGEPDTSPVGSFAPNGYGLYDMAGNVVEWCWDWYGTTYGQPNATNPTGPATGTDRVERGGFSGYYAVLARCANRSYYSPSEGFSGSTGFRCVKGL